MQCYVHSEREAVATCTNCGKAVCKSCMVEVGGKILCRQCVSVSGRAPQKAVQSIPTNPLAIISLVLGVLGLVGCLCGGSIGGILFGAPAVILGWIARNQLQNTMEELQGMQLATAGLVLGAVEIIISVLVLILFGTVYGWALFNGFNQY